MRLCKHRKSALLLKWRYSFLKKSLCEEHLSPTSFGIGFTMQESDLSEQSLSSVVSENYMICVFGIFSVFISV